jgi:hypothetical protein
MQLPTNSAANVYAARRFLMREPDRSRRVLRLVFANWLAQTDIPPEQGREPAVEALVQSNWQNASVPLYALGSDAPARARARSPRQIAESLVRTHDAQRVLGDSLRAMLRSAERYSYRRVVILLASELYRRERGNLPPSDEALLGTYLKRLPDELPAGRDDQTTPTISN